MVVNPETLQCVVKQHEKRSSLCCLCNESLIVISSCHLYLHMQNTCRTKTGVFLTDSPPEQNRTAGIVTKTIK